ncbi:MAG: hypothetical protein A2648_00670 [Candidatus Lloydbacteria bacterium RIFCSPHIGHO2_01_FULL_41_20]|uniref:Transglycosylase SLT domain-containing protein n=1 Tax=Candidatus Lloydbacteria bacterium RIFCSPHIGHO2_01_FULL_41_20 TaxID=1798657 RepID=A0A1G2CT73_9BACT|nr:MAG: hypothetical protein A2648_00670 [Candidatus Lloydbacteria bacterium RIFCSPHIGHO2_01_FULL_41_20]
MPTFAQTAEEVANRRTQLENDLKSLELQIDAQGKILAEKQKESVSLERDIAILDAKIKEADLSIKARNLSINKLSSEIIDKGKTIGVLTEKIDREKESLAQLLRKTRELDESSAIEFMLSGEKISQFFSDADTFISINSALRDSVVVVSQNKDETAAAKKSLEGKKEEEVSLRTIQELQRKRLAQDKTERNNLLKITRGKESEYQKILKDQQKSAAVIRAELFSLRDTAAIPFGKAVEYATQAGGKTGVRPALILGIITQESNLGENTGQCIVKNLTTGSGVGKNTGRFFATVMKPPRDTEPFVSLASRVGFDPLNTAVSCPPSYGYGGAMGPAQFIPSTWVLYEAKIASYTGHNPPNPWEPEDAFMAAAILLKENGGAGGVYNKERLAALRYFAGWTNATKKAYAFYGDDVMEITAKYQSQINILQGS